MFDKELEELKALVRTAEKAVLTSAWEVAALSLDKAATRADELVLGLRAKYEFCPASNDD